MNEQIKQEQGDQVFENLEIKVEEKSRGDEEVLMQLDSSISQFDHTEIQSQEKIEADFVLLEKTAKELGVTKAEEIEAVKNEMIQLEAQKMLIIDEAKEKIKKATAQSPEKEELIAEINEKEESDPSACMKIAYAFIKDPEKYLKDDEEAEVFGKFIESVGGNKQIIQELLGNDETATQTAEVLRNILIVENEKKPQKESKCRICGTALSSGSGFCGECGNETRFKNYAKLESVFDGVTESLPLFNEKLAKINAGTMTDDEKRFRNNMFYVASEALNSSNIGNRIKVSHWIKNNINEIDKIREVHVIKEDERTTAHDIIGQYTIENIITKTESSSLAKEVLGICMKENKKEHVDLDFYKLFNHEYSGSLRNRKRDIAVVVAGEFGIGDGIIDKWDKSKANSTKDEKGIEISEDSYEINIAALMKLEKIKPGSGKILFEEFGIANFARYTEETLLRQLDMKDIDAPYGVVIFPEADWNGAFFAKSSMLEKTKKKLQEGGFEMRIIEAGSQFEMARKLSKFDKKYKPAGNKISYVLLGGHGTKSSIQLGKEKYQLPEIDTGPPPLPEEFKSELEFKEAFVKWQERLEDAIDNQKKSNFDPRRTILADDLRDGNAPGTRKAAEKWFDENVPVVLISCSTGTENGIAQIAAGELGFTTTGPDRPTSVDNIDIKFNQNGKPVFEVEYADLNEYGKAETMKYVSGKKV